MNMYIRVALYYPLGLFSTILTWVLSPIICIPYRWEPRTDRVKRFDPSYNQYTFLRQYLLKCFSWFGTDDNAHDEYFWGVFGFENWSIEEYEASWWKQYICRVLWICRNPAYKFGRDILGFQLKEGYTVKETSGTRFTKTVWTNLDGSSAFLIEGGLGFKPLDNIKFGWKAHKGFDRLMLADRLLTMRSK
jgi:hypothetical protein